MSQGWKRDDAHGMANVEAELALLGAILFSNDAFDLVSSELSAEHFADPTNRLLFGAISDLIRSGRLADATTVWGRVQENPAMGEAGFGFLLDLVDRAPPAANAPDYANEIASQALRRDLYVLGDTVAELARKAKDTPENILAEAEKALLRLRTSGSRVRPLSPGEAIDRVFVALDAEAQSGITTGLEPLDKQLGPLLPGEAWVLGGRPGAGKSACAGVIATNVAMDQGRGVIEFNLEMPVEQLWRRRLCEVAFRINQAIAPAYSEVRRKQITEEQRALLHEAAVQLRNLPIQTVAASGLSMPQILSMARRQFAEWRRKGIEPGVVIIDHVGLVIGEGKSPYERATDVAIRGKQAATELQAPVIELAQLSRKVEERDNKRPTLPDLRDSGAIEENADGVIGFYRDAYYAEMEPEPKKEVDWAAWDERRRSRTIEAILLKVREGRKGTIKLWGDMARNVILGAEPTRDFFS